MPYKVKTPSGVLTDGEWSHIGDIPDRLPDRRERYFDTNEADVFLDPSRCAACGTSTDVGQFQISADWIIPVCPTCHSDGMLKVWLANEFEDALKAQPERWWKDNAGRWHERK